MAKLTGTNPDQVPTNADLGTIAYQDKDNVKIDGGSINLKDNDKIQLGDSSDLQIYHDGSNSFVRDAGTGDLKLQGSGSVFIQNGNGSETMAHFIANGAVDLLYDNATKLATTATGIDVTGNLTATVGVKVSTGVENGTAQFSTLNGNTSPASEQFYVGNNLGDVDLGNKRGDLKFFRSTTERMRVTSTGIDVTGNVVVSGTVDGRDIAANIPASLGTAGQVLTVNSGATAGEWADAAGGGGGLEYTTANTNLAAGGQYLLNIASNVTLTLPASPTTGSIIRIVAANGIDDGYTLTVARNGATISSLSEDLSVDTHGLDFIMWYNGTTWSLI